MWVQRMDNSYRFDKMQLPFHASSGKEHLSIRAEGYQIIYQWDMSSLLLLYAYKILFYMHIRALVLFFEYNNFPIFLSFIGFRIDPSSCKWKKLMLPLIVITLLF